LIAALGSDPARDRAERPGAEEHRRERAEQEEKRLALLLP